MIFFDLSALLCIIVISTVDIVGSITIMNYIMLWFILFFIFITFQFLSSDLLLWFSIATYGLTLYWLQIWFSFCHCVFPKLYICYHFSFWFLKPFSSFSATTGRDFKIINSRSIVYPYISTLSLKLFLVSIFILFLPNYVLFSWVFQVILAAITIIVFTLVACDMWHLARWHHLIVMAGNVGFTCWCHLSNIMPAVSSMKGWSGGITGFVFCLSNFFLFFCFLICLFGSLVGCLTSVLVGKC